MGLVCLISFHCCTAKLASGKRNRLTLLHSIVVFISFDSLYTHRFASIHSTSPVGQHRPAGVWT